MKHKKIKLTKNKYTIVDSEDYEYLNQWNWYCSKRKNLFYVVSTINNEKVLMHRFLMNPKKHQLIDHINGNQLDNRKCNLRIATKSTNAMNRGKPKSNTSGYKGVGWNKQKNTWVARVFLNQKLVFYRSFKNIKDAVLAYNEAALKYHGEFAKLNEIKK